MQALCITMASLRHYPAASHSPSSNLPVPSPNSCSVYEMQMDHISPYLKPNVGFLQLVFFNSRALLDLQDAA